MTALSFRQASTVIYADFKTLIKWMNCNQFCFYYTPDNSTYTISCVSLLTAQSASFSGTTSTFSTDFQNAVALTANFAVQGPLFNVGSYADFKTVVSTVNVGGNGGSNIIWMPAASINSNKCHIRACSSDFGWAVELVQGSTPSGIMTDFPSSMELTYFVLEI
jgi:hypothetical protein